MTNVYRQLTQALQADDAWHAYVLVDPLWGTAFDAERAALEPCEVTPITFHSPLTR